MRPVAVQTARAAVAAKAAAAAAQVQGPVGSACAMRCCRYLPKAAAPAMPPSTPAPTGSRLSRNNMPRNPRGDAPTAMRTPISWVLWVME